MVIRAQVGEPVPAKNAFDTDKDIIQVWENQIEKNFGFGFDIFVHFYFSEASGVSKIELVDSIFREADLPYSGWRYPKLTVLTWAIFLESSGISVILKMLNHFHLLSTVQKRLPSNSNNWQIYMVQ